MFIKIFFFFPKYELYWKESFEFTLSSWTNKLTSTIYRI